MTGTGTQADPYVVSSMADFLAAIATVGAYVSLAADIDAARDSTYQGCLATRLVFACTRVDGNDHTVKNCAINPAANYNGGLYEIADGCTVSHLKLLNWDLGAHSQIPMSAQLNSTIDHCSFSFINRKSPGFEYIPALSNGMYTNCDIYVDCFGYTSGSYCLFAFGAGSHHNNMQVHNATVEAYAMQRILASGASYSMLTGDITVTGSGVVYAFTGGSYNMCCASVSHTGDDVTIMASGGNNYVVSDLCSGDLAVQSGVGLTTAQAQSQEYLTSISFWGDCWTIDPDKNGGYPYINTASLPVQPGAFRLAQYLSDVTIPPTVKTIGRFAFADTMLDIVRISANCTRYDTSFPPGCEVWHYTENSNIVDSNGMYMVDCNGFLLAATEETEG